MHCIHSSLKTKHLERHKDNLHETIIAILFCRSHARKRAIVSTLNVYTIQVYNTCSDYDIHGKKMLTECQFNYYYLLIFLSKRFWATKTIYRGIRRERERGINMKNAGETSDRFVYGINYIFNKIKYLETITVIIYMHKILILRE